MQNIYEEIEKLEKELSTYPKGYISRKVINGKERFYLQWAENGKTISKYIKNNEYDSIYKLVEERKVIQDRLKELKDSSEGRNYRNSKRKERFNSDNLTGSLMMGDREIAVIKKGKIIDYDDKFLPLYLKRTKDIESWISSRAIDSHRTNSRLLKKVLRLKSMDDLSAALAVNAATVTDRYWFRPDGSKARYDDIRFKENYFDELALRGDPDSFSRRPSRTPELTNIGSFEKCWKLIDGKWWMYKSGNKEEIFSELFISKLGHKLGLDMAYYELDGDYIRTFDFTEGASVNFEPMMSLTGDNEDYNDCFDVLYKISPDIAKQYLLLIWVDTVCYNMDRHTENFGLLRDISNGRIIKLAPNFDNNIALISRGYPKDISRKKDGLIRYFENFVKSDRFVHDLYKELSIPIISDVMINDCINEISIDVDKNYIVNFILNGQNRVKEIIDSDSGVFKVEENGINLML